MIKKEKMEKKEIFLPISEKKEKKEKGECPYRKGK